jgi:hypothetical protein
MEVVVILAPDLRIDAAELIAIDSLARLPELRAKRLAIDYFVVPVSAALTEKTQENPPVEEGVKLYDT